MILLVHLLLGALIGQKTVNPFLAILLAFLSHYLLDFFPHVEYSVKNIKDKNWKKSLPDFIKVFLDIFTGIALILFFSHENVIIYICAFFAVLPDGLTVLSYFFPNQFFKMHNVFHREKTHFLKNKKISNFWRIFSQAAVALICIILL